MCCQDAISEAKIPDTIAPPDPDRTSAPTSPPTSHAPFTNPSSIIEPDEYVNDEGYAESTSTSYVSSIASDIRRGIVEDGRLHAAYGQYKPWVPVDDAETSEPALESERSTWPRNIPSAVVKGVDTAAVQPEMVPPNLQFEIDDVENEWIYGHNSFDFIHARELVLSIRNWPRLISQSFDHLKPGGYLQLAGSVPSFKTDDGTLPLDSASFWKDPLKWKDQLMDAGFEDVVERVFNIPTNPWPKDGSLKKIGAFELCHFRDGISNIFARGYMQILGGDTAFFQVLMAQARNEVMDRRIHSYLPFYVVYGKKPDQLAAV